MLLQRGGGDTLNLISKANDTLTGKKCFFPQQILKLLLFSLRSNNKTSWVCLGKKASLFYQLINSYLKKKLKKIYIKIKKKKIKKKKLKKN